MKEATLIYLAILCLSLLGCQTTGNSGSNTVRLAVETNDVAKANLRLGIAYLSTGKYEQALEKIQKARNADKNYPPVYNALGVLYQQLGDKVKAENFFKQALRLDGSDPSALNNYGQFLCQEARYDEAGIAFMKSASNPLYSTPEIALSNAGTCALTHGNIAIAESHFRSALEKNPNHPISLLQMAQVSYTNANYLSARGYLQRYLQPGSHTPKSLWLGIKIERELGDKDTLSSYILLLKNKFPDSKEVSLLKESLVK